MSSAAAEVLMLAAEVDGHALRRDDACVLASDVLQRVANRLGARAPLLRDDMKTLFSALQQKDLPRMRALEAERGKDRLNGDAIAVRGSVLLRSCSRVSRGFAIRSLLLFLAQEKFVSTCWG